MNQGIAWWGGIASVFVLLGVGGTVNAQKDTRADRYGDPLPDGVIARLGTVRLHFGGEVSSAAVSPDGSILIAAGRVCDGKTGKELPQFKGKYLAGTAFFSEDMSAVSIGKSNGIEQWEIATGKILEKNHWKEKWDSYDQAKFTPDLKHVIISSIVRRDSGAKVMETATRKTLLEFKDGERAVLSPDGRKLAVLGGDAMVVLWDVLTNREIRRWKAHERTPGQIYQFSPDSKTLASSVFGREIRFWNVETGNLIAEIKGVGGRHLIFSPDGKSILFDDGETIFMRDVGTGKETRRFVGHGSWLIPAMSFSANGKYLASASRDHTVILWDVATGKAMHDFVGHRGPVVSLAFSPTGDVLASGGDDDNTLIVWDLTSHEPRHFLRGHDRSVNCVAFSPDGKLIATGDGPGGTTEIETHLRLWDADNGELVHSHFAHINMVRSLVFIANGKQLISAGGDKRIRIWETVTGKRLHQVRNPHHSGLLSLTPDRKTLVQIGRPFGEMSIWDVATWQKKLEIGTGLQDSPAAIPLRDGKTVLVIASKRGNMDQSSMEVQYRAIETGNTIRSFVLKHFRYHQLRATALSPDETILAVCSYDPRDPTVQLYDTKTGELMTNLHGHTSFMECLAFSPTGKTLATAGWDTTVLLWDVPRAQMTRHWRALGLGIAESDRAAETLIANPQGAVALLGERLRRAAAMEKPYARFVADLGNERFETRDQAMKQLTQAGPAAELALGLYLEKGTELEHRRRVELLLEKADAARHETIDRLIGQLDGDGAQAAFLQLVAVGAAAEPRMRQALNKPVDFRARVSPRARFYVQRAIDRLQEPSNESTDLIPAQVFRAVSVLEAIGTPEATQVLRDLAAGPAESNLTREASLALKRLGASKKKPEARP